MAYQSGNFRQGKDLLHQDTKCALAHATHFRDHALYFCATSNKSVVSLLPLAVRIVAEAALQPLALVLVLLHFGVGFGKFSFQLLA